MQNPQGMELAHSLMPFIRSQKLEPVVTLCCYAMMPFATIFENLGVVIAAERVDSLQKLFALLGSRDALEKFVEEMEEGPHAGN